MTIFRDFQGPRPKRDIGIARPRRDRDTQKRVLRPRHVSRHPALVDMYKLETAVFRYNYSNNKLPAGMNNTV